MVETFFIFSFWRLSTGRELGRYCVQGRDGIRGRAEGRARFLSPSPQSLESHRRRGPRRGPLDRTWRGQGKRHLPLWVDEGKGGGLQREQLLVHREGGIGVLPLVLPVGLFQTALPALLHEVLP